MVEVINEYLKINEESVSVPEVFTNPNAPGRIEDPFYIAKKLSKLNENKMQNRLKRIIDITGSLTAISIFSPILLATAIAIKFESKGPILFKQERIGFCGKKFKMYKFRSMSQDAEQKLAELQKHNETNDSMFKMFDDPRITKVGKFIRKYSIDEMPQLLNVLKGEMSLVGPRPPIERELTSYSDWHYVRFSALPGLTGLWQVSGRSNITEFDKVVELDYKYAVNWDVLLDIKLMFKTVPVVLFGKDAA